MDTDEGLIVSAAVRDITERKRSQQAIKDLNDALRRANDELELRVAKRTAALAAQAAQLRATNDELDAFSYSVSHDLRSPLRAVDGFAKILVTNYSSVLDDAGKRYLDKVRSGAQHMGLLIDGLLSFSRLQRQSLTLSAVDMVLLSREIWGELETELIDRDVELTIDDLPPAHADPQLLRHVLGNLLDNALKFTRTRCPARIGVTAAVDDRGDVVYTVRDNGVGFDMRYGDKLFKVFQRLHRAEDYEGTGIGLALTARIIQRHGGTIWADGHLDAGAAFHFTLPRNRPDRGNAHTNHMDPQ
jgi:light-regulated signal transduction histidine kinase (bacteriophytochrome)